MAELKVYFVEYHFNGGDTDASVFVTASSPEEARDVWTKWAFSGFIDWGMPKAPDPSVFEIPQPKDTPCVHTWCDDKGYPGDMVPILE